MDKQIAAVVSADEKLGEILPAWFLDAMHVDCDSYPCRIVWRLYSTPDICITIEHVKINRDYFVTLKEYVNRLRSNDEPDLYRESMLSNFNNYADAMAFRISASTANELLIIYVSNDKQTVVHWSYSSVNAEKDFFHFLAADEMNK